jgi:hypothetical protein
MTTEGLDSEKYKEEKESADNFNIKYNVVRYVLHHR